MRPQKREAVDRAGLAFFEHSFLNFDATRERVAGDLAARLVEIDAQASRAARETSEKAAQAERVVEAARRGARRRRGRA